MEPGLLLGLSEAVLPVSLPQIWRWRPAKLLWNGQGYEIREHIEGSGVAASVEYTRDHAKIVLYDVTVEDIDRLIDANLQYVRSAIGE